MLKARFLKTFFIAVSLFAGGRVLAVSDNIFTKISGPSIPSPARSVAWRADSAYFATVTDDSSSELQIFSVAADGTYTQVATGQHGAYTVSVDWHPSGNFIAIGGGAGKGVSGTGSVRVFKFTPPSTLVDVASHVGIGKYGIQGMRWHPNGKNLAIGDSMGEVGIYYWDGSALLNISSFKPSTSRYREGVVECAWHSIKPNLLLVGTYGQGKVFNVAIGENPLINTDSQMPGLTTSGTYAAIWDNDYYLNGHSYLMTSDQGKGTKKDLGFVAQHASNAIELSPGKDIVYVCSGDSIKAYSYANGIVDAASEFTVLSTKYISRARLSPSGKFFVLVRTNSVALNVYKVPTAAIAKAAADAALTPNDLFQTFIYTLPTVYAGLSADGSTRRPFKFATKLIRKEASVQADFKKLIQNFIDSEVKVTIELLNENRGDWILSFPALSSAEFQEKGTAWIEPFSKESNAEADIKAFLGGLVPLISGMAR